MSDVKSAVISDEVIQNKATLLNSENKLPCCTLFAATAKAQALVVSDDKKENTDENASNSGPSMKMGMSRDE